MNQASPLPATSPAIPVTLYIHYPWCVRKCPYCDFNSHDQGREWLEPRYLQALESDLIAEAPWLQGRALHSIFIGGGTPSLLAPAYVGQILDTVARHLCIAPAAEITLEANPGTLHAQQCRTLRHLGINRLSLGIQSFDDRSLVAIGRIHDGRQALEACREARDAGFDQINLDLMFGLPGQTLAQARQDLQQALALEPEHLSYYQLTLEPNTRFHQHPPQLPDDDTLAAIEDQGHEQLSAAGYLHYEISAHARPGRACRHNLNYWQFGDYLAVGPGAHGKCTMLTPGPDQGKIARRWKIAHPREYLDRHAADQSLVAGERWLNAEDRLIESLLNGLRLQQGVDWISLSERTGLSQEQFRRRLMAAETAGLVSLEPRLCATPLGWRFLNELLALI